MRSDKRATRRLDKGSVARAASRLTQLLADGGDATEGQRRILAETLAAMFTETGVGAYDPGNIETLYTTACECLGAARFRHAITLALDLIERGEAFDDYKEGDGIHLWKDKRRSKTNAVELRIAAEINKALEGGGEYKQALLDAVRRFAELAGVPSEGDAGKEYLEANAERCGVSINLPSWDELWASRAEILDLLEGLRKKRPLAQTRGRMAERNAKPSTRSAQRRSHRVHLCNGSVGNLGYARGEWVLVTEADDLKAGDPAAFYAHGQETVDIGRVIAITFKTITVRYASGEDQTIERAGLDFLGRVASACSPLTGEQEKRISELRKHLSKLSDITDSSEAFVIEREIYDIEQSAIFTDDESLNDWPEVLRVVGEKAESPTPSSRGAVAVRFCNDPDPVRERGAAEPPEQFATFHPPPGCGAVELYAYTITDDDDRIAIVVVTDRPARGEWAAVELTDGRRFVGRYYPTRGGGRSEFGDEYEDVHFTREEVVRLMRVAHFEREGEIVEKFWKAAHL